MVLFACSEQKKELPVYGQTQLNDKGEEVDHTIAPFRFTNQDGEVVSDSDYEGTVYVSDFFFTTCKTICPEMTIQLARLQKELGFDGYKILSHTVNPETDSEEVLRAYADNMGADLKNWDFVTGDAQTIYRQAASYQVAALKDTNQLMPFVHSEYLILIDKKSRVRGLYDGTSTEEVDKLITDLKWLIKQ